MKLKNINYLERRTVLLPKFIDDFEYWIKTDRKIALRVIDLIKAVIKEPFSGIGKPEHLRFLGPDVWSRRITQEHRLVYVVYNDRVDFLQCRYHYE